MNFSAVAWKHGAILFLFHGVSPQMGESKNSIQSMILCVNLISWFYRNSRVIFHRINPWCTLKMLYIEMQAQNHVNLHMQFIELCVGQEMFCMDSNSICMWVYHGWEIMTKYEFHIFRLQIAVKFVVSQSSLKQGKI